MTRYFSTLGCTYGIIKRQYFFFKVELENKIGEVDVILNYATQKEIRVFERAIQSIR